MLLSYFGNAQVPSILLVVHVTLVFSGCVSRVASLTLTGVGRTGRHLVGQGRGRSVRLFRSPWRRRAKSITDETCAPIYKRECS